MTYYNRNTHRRQSRPVRAITPGRVARVNARPGPCYRCDEIVPAGAGQLWRRTDGTWEAIHVEASWAGSPVSGQYVGGCPSDTDQMNEQGRFGEPGARSEADRLGAVAGTYAAMNTSQEMPS